MSEQPADKTALAADLAARYAAGEAVLEPLFEEALRLLDEDDDDLSEAARAFFDDVRFAYFELSGLMTPRARDQRTWDLREHARAFAKSAGR